MSPTSISWDYWAPPRKVTSPEAVPHRLVSKYSPTVTAQDSRLSQNWLRAVLSNAICTSTPVIPATVRIDSAGNNHILTSSLSGGVLRRNTICDKAISRYTSSTMAPDELSRNWNTVFGATPAMITHRKPTTDEPTIAR